MSQTEPLKQKNEMNDEQNPKEQHNREVFADLGQSIQQLRQHHGLTVEEAANAADLTPAKLAAIERGTMYNNLNKVARIVEALHGRLAIVIEESPDDPHCKFLEA
jgi:transcriptional regulator with XRE-family HTH domain